MPPYVRSSGIRLPALLAIDVKKPGPTSSHPPKAKAKQAAEERAQGKTEGSMDFVAAGLIFMVLSSIYLALNAGRTSED